MKRFIWQKLKRQNSKTIAIAFAGLFSAYYLLPGLWQTDPSNTNDLAGNSTTQAKSDDWV